MQGKVIREHALWPPLEVRRQGLPHLEQRIKVFVKYNRSNKCLSLCTYSFTAVSKRSLRFRMSLFNSDVEGAGGSCKELVDLEKG